MDVKKYILPEDEEHIINIRREIHRHPELGFDLPNTASVVKRELDAIGVKYSEEYAPGSVVAYINSEIEGPCIALRADMDALPIGEDTDVPYKSEVPGVMHACGHDAHTAMLIGAARALKRAEKELSCSVRLFFQPSEERVDGACLMVNNGVMDGVDFIFGQHCNPYLPAGSFGFCEGDFMAAYHTYTIEFHGKSAHAAVPHMGHDTLAMAVKAYNDIYLMKARELSPFSKNVISISSLTAGEVHNIVPNYAKMLISLRFFDNADNELIDRRIKQICENAAAELDGEVCIADTIASPPLINDLELTRKLRKNAEKLVGAEHIFSLQPNMGSEDFAHYLCKAPGVFFQCGVGDPEWDKIESVHSSLFRINEKSLIQGAAMMAQLAMDYNA